ncbi:MAG: peptide deformylase [Spirochaetales bacterium]|nr:peptide deformylase [Spirochaetales bacterium]
MKLARKSKVEGCTCEPVTMADLEAVVSTAEEMFAILKKKDALGLAAPQVRIFKKFFIMKSYNGEKYQLIINPEIIQESPKMGSFQEGCLTYPGETAVVKRPKQCKVRWMNADGNMRSAKLTGRESQIFLHEFDHLEGITIFTKK